MSDPTWGLHIPGYSSPSPRAHGNTEIIVEKDLV